ncbi:DUF3644 domain-containing protein [Micromonospora tulbaghiae]|uniref:DUF3644 domain-containing protein n=1 Tax=Micromonospora tulbaghiae TaxID=479978 RepID=UPI00341AA2B6
MSWRWNSVSATTARRIDTVDLRERGVMARRPRHWPMVAASQAEASLAVRLYNDPAEERSFEGFVVHMHLAWLYLLHGEFTRDGKDFRYRKRGNPRLLERVDGEPKRWELAKCVAERWSDDDPIRRNIEFFIGLRNKIEHRYASKADLSLTVALGGYAQALLLNYEEELVGQFGEAATLAGMLRFPLFVGSFTDAGETTLRRLRKGLPAPLRKFVAEYESGLSVDLINDRRYEFRLRVTNELAPKDPDALAIQYTRYDDMTEEQKLAVEELGRKGFVVVREQKRGVVNYELLKPRQVVLEVAQQIPFVFHMGHFVRAWQKLEVRPVGGSEHPERTDEKYCHYDALHRDYGYSKAYVKKLVRSLKSADGWRNLFGDDPQDKKSGEWIAESEQHLPGQRRSVEVDPESEVVS